MAYYYDLTNLTSGGSLDAIARFSNEVAGGFLFDFILLALWLIIFSWISVTYGERKGLFVSSFIVAISSYLLMGMGLVQPYIVIIPTFVTAYALLILKKE